MNRNRKAPRLKNTHRVVVTVRFDRRCTRALALREMRDTIYGNHYCSALRDGEPEEFRIRAIKLAPQQES